MTKDFNIRNSDQDPSFPHHSQHTDDLLTIADSLRLDLSTSINPVPTRYTNNSSSTNSVLDLAFLPSLNRGFNQHKSSQSSENHQTMPYLLLELCHDLAKQLSHFLFFFCFLFFYLVRLLLRWNMGKHHVIVT